MKKRVFAATAALALTMSAMPALALDIEVKDIKDVDKYYVFTLDGEEYQLPCKVADLQKNGWEFSYVKDTDTIPGMTYYISTDMVKGDASIEIELWNPNGGLTPASEGMAAGITISTNSNVDFATCDGLTVASTKEEVVKARGEDTDASYSTYNYSYEVPQDSVYLRSIGAYDGDNTTSFQFADDDTVQSLELEYFLFPEDADITVSDERPAYLDTYKAPDSLGSKIEDMNFEVNGKVASFPIPTDVFMKEFEMTSKDEISIPAQAYRVSSLYDKDGNSDAFSFYNNAEYMVSLENSFICDTDWYWSDSTDLKDVEDAFTFSGGVKFGMSEDELFNICPELKETTDDTSKESGDFEYSKSEGDEDNTYYIKNTATNAKVSIRVDKKRGVVSLDLRTSSEWGLK